MNFDNTRLWQYLDTVVLKSTFETIRMLLATSFFAIILGLILAVLLVLTAKDGLRPCQPVYKLINAFTNVIRSFPSLILIVALIPLTRLLFGTSIGWVAAVFPLTIATTPVATRLIETPLREVDHQVIEAVQSFGASTLQIVIKVMLRESLPSVVSNLTTFVISVLGVTTIAGAVGAGGLGAAALTFGYQRFDDLLMYTVVAIMLVIVFAIQLIGNLLYKRLK